MTRELRARRSSQTGGLSQIVWIFAAFVFGYITAGFYDLSSLSRLVERMQDKQMSAKHAASKPEIMEVPKPKFEFYTLLTKDSQGNIKRMVPETRSQQTANSKAHAVQQPARLEQTAQNASSQTLTAVTTLKQRPPVAVSRPLDPIVSQPQVDKPIIIKPKQTLAVVKGTFLIQIAAFNRRDDAERMKASLLLKGYDASVVAYARPGTHWFRVVIGPYHNKTDVEKIQTSLYQRHHIRGIVRQMPA